jgi:hypothetical protein
MKLNFLMVLNKISELAVKKEQYERQNKYIKR